MMNRRDNAKVNAKIVQYSSTAPKIVNVGRGRSTKLIACTRCHLLKTAAQFGENGCENCPEFESVEDNTTTLYEGVVTILDPPSSYVARTMGLNDVVPGVYAMSILSE